MSWPSKEDRSDYRTTLQYLGRACLSLECASQTSLRACSRCKRAKYCSPECQKRDYRSHKQFCVAYSLLDPPVIDPEARVQRGENSNGPTPTQWELEKQPYLSNFHPRITGLLRALGPQVTKIANYLGYLFPRCLWCYAPDPAKVCSTCKIAAWCPGLCAEKGAAAHEGAHCKTCQDIVRDDDFIRTSPSFLAARFCPERVLSEPAPASLFKDGWDSYLPTISLPPLLNDPAILDTIITRQISLPLTIIAALQRFGLIDKFSGPEPSKTLRIHLMGAERDYELVAGGLACEELMHLLPGVKTLEWTMVGPSMGKIGNSDEGSTEVDPCPTCQDRGRKRILGWHNMRYQTYASQPGAPRPDLAIGFNCGMHEQPQSWGPVLDYLSEQRIPSVFTSYSAGEAAADAHVVHSSRIPMMWMEEPNVWAGRRPQWDFCVEGGAWFENGYWLGFGPHAEHEDQ